MKRCEPHLARRRHPWETARVQAVGVLLREQLHEGMSVLDVACGDGYLCRSLFGGIPGARVTAVATDLTDATLRRLEPAQGVVYAADLPAPGRRFELTLMLDVLERMELDRKFVKRVVWQHLAAEGHLLITVPAFQSLYSGNDWLLGRYRRYRLRDLHEIAAGAGLTVLSSGYLFGSLLLPKFLSDRFFSWGKVADLGNWRWGRYSATVAARAFALENVLMIGLTRAGITLPGLSAWALCRSRVPHN